MKFRHCLSVAGALILSCGLLACGAKDEEGAAGKTGTEVDMVVVSANLALADVADGTEDKIISKCLTCNLGMDGNPANTQEIHEYTLHFCDSCKDGLGEDADAVIAKMTFPNK